MEASFRPGLKRRAGGARAQPAQQQRHQRHGGRTAPILAILAAVCSLRCRGAALPARRAVRDARSALRRGTASISLCWSGVEDRARRVVCCAAAAALQLGEALFGLAQFLGQLALLGAEAQFGLALDVGQQRERALRQAAPTISSAEPVRLSTALTTKSPL